MYSLYKAEQNGKRAHLNRGRHKEELLLETELLAILSGIIGVKHRADVLSLALLVNCLQQNIFVSAESQIDQAQANGHKVLNAQQLCHTPTPCRRLSPQHSGPH